MECLYNMYSVNHLFSEVYNWFFFQEKEHIPPSWYKDTTFFTILMNYTVLFFLYVQEIKERKGMICFQYSLNCTNLNSDNF